MNMKLLRARRMLAPAVILTVLSAGWVGAQTTVQIRKVQETEWRDGPLDSTAVDWSFFPKGYGILANERLMYPVDVSDWPVKIGPERQLFVDSYLVAEASFVRRTVHQPVKYEGNPIMVDREPWEKDKKVILLQVLRDPDTGKFRMWYTIWVRFTFPGTQTKGRHMPTLYAESEDGIHWVRPKLGLLEYQGSKENNWVINGRMYGLIHHPDAADPSRKFLAAVMHEPPYEKESLYLYASPDGLRWTRIRKEPILILRHKDPRFPLEGLGDTSIVRYDPVLQRYVCDAKITFRQPDFRTRGILTSPDLIHWTRPRMTIYPDALDDADAQIYANISFPYESMWLGMLRVYHHARTGFKQVDIELTSSRDGLNWSRVGNREIFLPLGAADSWEADYTDPANGGPLLVGDEIWIFYRGCKNLRRPNKKDWEFATGLAKLRRDGFVSIDAADQPGTLTTRPLTFDGNKLYVNAKIIQGGEMRVGLLRSDGTPIAGYGVQDCQPVTGDSTRQQVTWKGSGDLSSARQAGEQVRLSFRMKNAQLFSFWIE